MKIDNAAKALATILNACGNEWFWEDCSWKYWRDPCPDESWGNGEWGWVYMDDKGENEFWVNEAEFASWPSCWDY